jgi:putative tricarboxylic transport membrane protein
MAFGGAIALGAGALGLVALAMPIRAGEFLLGPRLFPYIVMGGLVFLGLLVSLSGWRGAPGVLGTPDVKARAASPPGVIDAEASPPIDDWPALAQTGGGLALFCLLVEGAGFVIAAAALFAAVAFAFGARRIRDFAIGFALAAVTFAVFKFGLGLNLPTGQWLRPLLAAW